MTTKRSIILFWVLFLVPTLIMAGAAARLLSHEQERINQSRLMALTDRADTIAQTIHLTIETIKDNLTQALIRIPGNTLKPILLKWEETNPLVRNVFVYKPGVALSYPAKGMASTPEERRFMARFDALFSGRVPFDGGETKDPGESAGSALAKQSDKTSSYSSRKQLVELSKAVTQAPQTAMESQQPQAVTDNSGGAKSGWLPWFSENRLHLLIWVQTSDSGPIYGLELELMTLLSRLVVDFPKLDEGRTALVLMDGSNRSIHQAGDMEINPGTRPAVRVDVSSLLPHWEIAVFMDNQGVGAANGFLVLSLVLVGVFIAAIVSGGILLTRMTLKNMNDARQKTSFVSSVSHELKTPLTSIRMYAELLLSGRIKEAAKKENYLSVIVTESERLTRLINNVLDFGKLEQGRKTYRMTRFEMDFFLYQVIDAHRIRIKTCGLEIKTNIKEGDYTLSTDRDAIEQVVLNLLDNALKYAGDGRFVEFILEKETDNTILFKICDDGLGIPKSQQAMIFKKFHRVDNSLTATQPGSGLGLSIARQILRDLGGDLTCESIKGSGSCFTARIKDHDNN